MSTKLTDEERNERVDRLLHDAQRAEAGAKFAHCIGHHVPAEDMSSKAISLRLLAAAIDPEKKAPAWAEDAELDRQQERA